MEIILDGGVRRGSDSEAVSETAIFHVDLLVNVPTKRSSRPCTPFRTVLRPFNTIVSQPPSVHFFAKSLRILFHAFADKPIPTAGA